MKKRSIVSRLQSYFSSPKNVFTVIVFIVLAVYVFVCGQGALMNNVIKNNITYGASSFSDEANIDDSNSEQEDNNNNDRYEFKISIVDCCLFGILVIVYICKKIYDKRKQKRRTK